MFEHLGNPEYLHVLLNPLPVYGLVMGVFGLVVAIIQRSTRARFTALAIIFVSAFSAWPVYHYGEAGYDRVLAMSDDPGGRWLDEHKRRGEKLIGVFYVVAGLAAAAMVAQLKFVRAAVPLAIITTLTASATLGVGFYIASAGGRIRHKEFRYESPPLAHEREKNN